MDTLDNLRKNCPNLFLVQSALLLLQKFVEVLVFAQLHDNIELVLQLIGPDVRYNVWVLQSFHESRLLARLINLVRKHICQIMLLEHVSLTITLRCNLVYCDETDLLDQLVYKKFWTQAIIVC